MGLVHRGGPYRQSADRVPSGVREPVVSVLGATSLKNADLENEDLKNTDLKNVVCVLD